VECVTSVEYGVVEDGILLALRTLEFAVEGPIIKGVQIGTNGFEYSCRRRLRELLRTTTAYLQEPVAKVAAGTVAEGPWTAPAKAARRGLCCCKGVSSLLCNAVESQTRQHSRQQLRRL